MAPVILIISICFDGPGRCELPQTLGYDVVVEDNHSIQSMDECDMLGRQTVAHLGHSVEYRCLDLDNHTYTGRD
jgi:hypothetical protein